jgi:hypothetical protein
VARLTRAELHAFAQMCDGCCKVVKLDDDTIELVSQDDEIGTAGGFVWDYYMTDEPDSFPFAKYGIEG